MEQDLIYWLAQAVGALGVVAGIWASAQKEDKRLITGFMISNILVAIQMIGLGAFATAGASVVSSARLYFASKTQRTDIMLVFMAALLVQWFFVGKSVELFLVAGSLISTFGYFKLQGGWLRLSLVLMNCFWCPVLVYYDAYLPALFYGINSLLMLPVIRQDWRDMMRKNKPSPTGCKGAATD